MESDVPGLPVMLNVAGRRCVVVGGGPVAARRATTLVACGAQVVVIAPAMDENLDRLLIERRDRGYEAGDLDGAFFVVIATDDPAVNQQVAADADEEGVLVNRADAPGTAPHGKGAAPVNGGDVTVMGHDRRGPLTIAVDTGHTSAAASKAIRRELLDKLDADWVTLLETARPWRTRVKRAVKDPAERGARLRRLTDAAAMLMLKDRGASALKDHLRRVAEGDGSGEANSGGDETL